MNINLSIFDEEKEDSISFPSSKTNEKSREFPSPQVSKSPSSESIKAPSPPPLVQVDIQPPSSPPVPELVKPPSPPPVQVRNKSPSPPSIPEPKQAQPSTITNEYDEDFSEVSRSPIDTPTKPPIDNLDIESIHEDIDEKPSIHDTNQSLTSKSSADEQSEILVLGKKSVNNTPRQEDKTLEEEIPPPPTPTPPMLIQSDDTSHDISEEDDRTEQANKIEQLTETLIRTFIDEAIDHGKDIGNLKTKIPITKEASEWMSDEDLTDDDTNKQIPITQEDVE